jgi:hypothetical protein
MTAIGGIEMKENILVYHLETIGYDEDGTKVVRPVIDYATQVEIRNIIKDMNKEQE